MCFVIKSRSWLYISFSFCIYINPSSDSWDERKINLMLHETSTGPWDRFSDNHALKITLCMRQWDTLLREHAQFFFTSWPWDHETAFKTSMLWKLLYAWDNETHFWENMPYFFLLPGHGTMRPLFRGACSESYFMHETMRHTFERTCPIFFYFLAMGPWDTF